MTGFRNGPGHVSANLTPAQARALRLLSEGDVLVSHDRHACLIGSELFRTPTVQSLLRRGFVTRPRDLFQTDAGAGRITDSGRHVLDWRAQRAAA